MRSRQNGAASSRKWTRVESKMVSRQIKNALASKRIRVLEKMNSRQAANGFASNRKRVGVLGKMNSRQVDGRREVEQVTRSGQQNARQSKPPGAWRSPWLMVKLIWLTPPARQMGWERAFSRGASFRIADAGEVDLILSGYRAWIKRKFIFESL
jgi:hypothetical protein